MKFLAELTNLNIMIEDEDKALKLLSSLPDEGYKTFVLTLTNGRTSLSYKEVTTAFVNLELRKKDKESSESILAKVLLMGINSLNQRGSQRRSKSKNYGGQSQCNSESVF